MAGIYIHIPYCKQACVYCNFHFSTNTKTSEALIEAILREIDLRKDYLKGETIGSIYFGGGTPSHIPSLLIEKILTKIHQNFSVESNAEISFESNPDDLSAIKLKELKSLGINRLSIGLQSFDEDELKWMNRAHNANESKACLDLAFQNGFDNISIDLIYGSPYLNEAKWTETLKYITSLPIDHISAYSLTVEELTALNHQIKQKKITAPEEIKTEKYFEMLISHLASSGFEHYEISNFARNKKYSKHNTSYWFNKNYLGLGPAAHSYNGLSRQYNIANNTTYIKQVNEVTNYYEVELLSAENIWNETIMTRLRTQWGVEKKWMEKHTAFYNEIDRELKLQLNLGNIELRNGSYILTLAGKKIADQISASLFV